MGFIFRVFALKTGLCRARRLAALGPALQGRGGPNAIEFHLAGIHVFYELIKSFACRVAAVSF